MSMSRSRVTAAAAACLLAAACTGGAPASSSGDGGDPQSLTYLIEEPEDAEALQALEDHIGAFEQESGIEVDVRTLPFDTLRTVLQTQLR
jgi:raffinose/stachyose/melibiose transport system substrate-binding protein